MLLKQKSSESQLKSVPVLTLWTKKWDFVLKPTVFPHIVSAKTIQKLPILLSKKTTKRGGGGQTLPILRQHSLWTAP